MLLAVAGDWEPREALDLLVGYLPYSSDTYCARLASPVGSAVRAGLVADMREVLPRLLQEYKDWL